MINYEAEEYYNIGDWLSKKLKYHKCSKYKSNSKIQVNHGEIWYCDLGFNVGTEKNKIRPVLIMSNNKINQSEKVVVICITDAKGKTNQQDLPAQDSWYLLYSSTLNDKKMIYPKRKVKKGAFVYNFLEKDSVVQCEEIRVVSKTRLDSKRGKIGDIYPKDFINIKGKFLRAYNL